MTKKLKLVTFIVMIVVIVGSLVIGILLGDPQGIRIEGSGL